MLFVVVPCSLWLLVCCVLVVYRCSLVCVCCSLVVVRCVPFLLCDGLSRVIVCGLLPSFALSIYYFVCVVVVVSC